MAARLVDKLTSVAPNFPDLIERQFNYPAYTYELMFGCTGGDFTHGLLCSLNSPWVPSGRDPKGGRTQPHSPRWSLYLCGARVPRRPPGVTFIPGYNCGYAVLDAAGWSRLKRSCGAPRRPDRRPWKRRSS